VASVVSVSERAVVRVECLSPAPAPREVEVASVVSVSACSQSGVPLTCSRPAKWRSAWLAFSRAARSTAAASTAAAATAAAAAAA
jgi:hypothetical protein